MNVLNRIVQKVKYCSPERASMKRDLKKKYRVFVTQFKRLINSILYNKIRDLSELKVFADKDLDVVPNGVTSL